MRGSDARGNGVGGERSVTGGDGQGFRIRVRGRGEGGPEDGPRSELSIEKDAAPVSFFVPIRRVSSSISRHFWSFFDLVVSCRFLFRSSKSQFYAPTRDFVWPPQFRQRKFQENPDPVRLFNISPLPIQYSESVTQINEIPILSLKPYQLIQISPCRWLMDFQLYIYI